MKIKTIILYYFFISIIFWSACSKEQKNIPLGFAPMSQIVKLHPVKIMFARWIEYEDEILNLDTEQEFEEAVKNPENWIVYLEITDMDQINIIMDALSKTPVEPYSNYMLPMGDKINFVNENGSIVWTSLNIISEEKRVYLGDKICGQETYNVLVKILNIKQRQ